MNTFADATDDHQWIHVDPERATAESPFGAPIAHGFLSLSLAVKFWSELLDVTEVFDQGQLRPRQGALRLAGQGRSEGPDERGRR